jgi:AraC-like DNA-binding protein
MTNSGTGSFDDTLKGARDVATEITKIRANVLTSVDAVKDLSKEFKKSSTLLKTSFELSTDLKHALDDTRNLASKIGREYIDQEIIQSRINANSIETQVIQTNIDKIQNDINKSLQKSNKPAQDLKTMYADIEKRVESTDKKVRKKVTADEQALYVLMKEKNARELNAEELKKLNDLLDKGNAKVKEAQLKASALAKIFGSMTGIPFLKDFMDFKKISDAFKVSTKEGFSALGSEIMRVVKSPLFLMLITIAAIAAAIKALVKIAFDFDKQLVQISNNLGITRNSAIGILDNFRQISNENRNIVKGLDSAFLSVKNQVAATAELQEVLETNSLFTSKMVQSQILLTKQMGLSKEESAGIQKISLLSGKSADDILQNAIKQNTTAISYRKIISDISKINSEISVMYKNNPDLIAKAVIEANKLGLSLEQTQKISKSLLDFETSIAGELEAELLIGKRFNFEKARALALDGKSVEAAKELMDQMGGLNGLTNLNVIQRDRLAASIGMSAEELTKAAREQEVLNKLGFQNKQALEEQYALLRSRNDTAGMAALMEEARKKEGGEVLLQDIARADLQKRFEESVERIKQIFTEMAAGPMIKILEGIAKFLSNTTALKVVLGVVVGLAVSLAAAIAMATGGLSLVLGGLAGVAAVGGLSFAASGNDTQYTPQVGANSVVPNLNTSAAIMPSAPNTAYSTPQMNNTDRRVEGSSAFNQMNNTDRRDDKTLGANQKDTVIQNNIVLQVDGIGIGIAQKRTDTKYA